MKRTLLLAIVLLIPPAILQSAELVHNGVTAWKIVLPRQPTIVEKTAARELSEQEIRRAGRAIRPYQ